MALNKDRQILYMIAILSSLLLIYFDMLFEKRKGKVSNARKLTLKYLESLEITKVIAEAIIEETFKDERIYSNNTFQSISNKIETVIRKEANV